MTLFPIFADLKTRAVLVVGGGTVAERKAVSLLKAGAQVTVGAPELSPSLLALAAAGKLDILGGRYAPEWLEGKWLVIAATNDRDVNQEVARHATAGHLFVNVVDDPVLSSFQVPSIVDRSPIIVAISSSGSAPVLARRLRERIETLFDHSIGSLASLAQKHRSKIRRLRPDLARRREFYDWLFDGPVSSAVRRQQPQLAATLLHAALDTSAPPPVGKVILVGAGPGDPGLLTLKALRALNEADVILHDRLVSKEVLDLARRDADFVSVGKSPGEDHNATQRRIHQLMLEHANAGRRVVRLKGGDGFIFGRGGEELEFLAQHNIDYEIVPGITAAVACAAYTGIPLTHRDHAQSVTLTTAHTCKGNLPPIGSVQKNTNQTLAFYMGISQLGDVADRLIQNGHSADTPFALVENGTHPGQRTLTGDLRTLAAQARQHKFASPSLLLVGEVTALASRLHWFGELIEAQPIAEHALA